MMRGSLISACVLALVFTGGCSDDTQPADLGPNEDGKIDMSVDLGEDGPRPDGAPDGPPLDIRPADLPDQGRPPDLTVCGLVVSQVNGKAPPPQVSSLDDKDGGKAGIQIDVLVQAFNAADGLDITLNVTGLAPAPTAKVTGGFAQFSGVTISPTTSVATITANAAGCQSTPLSVNVIPDPTCVFTKPVEGATLTSQDDTIPGNGTFDFTMVLTTTNATGGSVSAKIVGGASLGAQPVQTATGLANFINQAFNNGPNEITADVEVTIPGGQKLTNPCLSNTQPKLKFTVDTTAPPCTVATFDPKGPTTSKGLVLNDKDPTGAAGVQNTITVNTDGSAEIEITLLIGGQSFGPTKTTTGSVAFDVTLADGNLDVRAVCTNVATKNQGQSGITKVVVDTVDPSTIADLACTIDTTAGNHRKGILTCDWTHSNDGGSGVEFYDLHCYKNAVIDDTNFAAAPIKLSSIQLTPTTKQKVDVTGLSIPNSYSCAVQASDFAQNKSAVSNVPATATFDFQKQTILGESTGDRFGFPVVVGDFNCDTLPDIAVGLFTANGGRGEVRLFFGSGVGFPAFASKRIRGTAPATLLGNQLAALDYNKDGCTDLAVFSIGSKGRVHLYLGRSVWPFDRSDLGTGDGPEVVWELDATAGVTHRLSGGIATADLDGDGFGDLATNYYDTASAAGFAKVLVDYSESGIPLMGTGVSPDTRKMPGAAELTIEGGTFGSKFGIPTISSGSKLLSTTHGSLVIGARAETLTSGGVGAIYVVEGAAKPSPAAPVTLNLSSPRVHRLEGTATSKNFGWRSTTADIDGDGKLELIVAGSDEVNTAGNTGAVYVFQMSPIPTAASQAAVRIGNDLPSTSQENFGITLGVRGQNVGDLNKDGKADILVTARGTTASPLSGVYLFFGRALNQMPTVASGRDRLFQPTDAGDKSFGGSVRIIGDVNSDGFDDFAISDAFFNSSQGRLIVYF